MTLIEFARKHRNPNTAQAKADWDAMVAADTARVIAKIEAARVRLAEGR